MLFPIVGFLQGGRPDTSWLDWLKDWTPRIKCPACGWRPGKHAKWTCDPGCGHCWNTFETGGVCPECRKAWEKTACLECTVWSSHDAWYGTE
jgi:hypothetical protein